MAHKFSLKRLGADPLFVLMVVVPTLLATIYYGLIASNIFISESRVVVHSPDKPQATSLGVLLKGAGFSSAGEDIFAVRDFIESRDAMHQVNRDGILKKAFGGAGVSIFDRFDPLGWGGGEERLYQYYQKMVSVDYDTASSILTVHTRAFDPVDAQIINQRLIALSENLTNRLNERGREDLIKAGEEDVEQSKKQAVAASQALATYRNDHGVLDPGKQAEAGLLMIGKIQDQLISSRIQLRELQASTPLNPQIPVLKVRVAGLEKEVRDAMRQLAGDPSSLAAASGRYQQLSIDSDVADKQLVAAMAALADARSEAHRKQAYVERIVSPNLPDYPLEPRRIHGILAIFAIGFAVWLVSRMLLAGVREHTD